MSKSPSQQRGGHDPFFKCQAEHRNLSCRMAYSSYDQSRCRLCILAVWYNSLRHALAPPWRRLKRLSSDKHAPANTSIGRAKCMDCGVRYHR